MKQLLLFMTVALTLLSCEEKPTKPPEPEQLPMAAFLAEVQEGTLEVVFDAAASVGGLSETITRFIWDFGDSKVDTVYASKTTHTYGTHGKYTVRLTIENEVGSDTATRTVVIPEPVVLVDFNIIRDPNNPLRILLNASKSRASSQYEWKFGDGKSRITTASNVSHEYAKPDTYEITLTTDHGETRKTITVTETRPPLTLEVEQDQSNPATVVLRTNAGEVECVWRLGDGNERTTTTGMLTYTYRTSGRFTVTLETGERTKEAMVEIPLTLSITRDPARQNVVTLTANTQEGGTWTFGDEESAETETSTVTHTYPERGGDYETTFRTENAVATITVTVPDLREPLILQGVKDSNDPATVTFTVIGGESPFQWTLENEVERETEEPTITHTYQEDGVYTITVFSGGRSAQITINIQKVTTPLTIQVQQDPQMSANVRISTEAEAEVYIWDLDDGTVRETVEPFITHTYGEERTYLVTLTANNQVTQATVVVSQIEPITFQIGWHKSNPMTVYLQGPERRENGAEIVLYEWSFGDGRFERNTDRSTQYTYSTRDVHPIRLTVTDAEDNTEFVEKPFNLVLLTTNQGKERLITQVLSSRGPHGSLVTLFTDTPEDQIAFELGILITLHREDRIPAENTPYLQQFGSRGITHLLTDEQQAVHAQKALVVTIPEAILDIRPMPISLMREATPLWVIDTGTRGDVIAGQGDLWSLNHPHWTGKNEHYQNMMELVRDGALIVGTLADQAQDGSLSINEDVFPCGDTAENCFTVINRNAIQTRRKSLEASALLSSTVYWLSQVHGTAQATTETLKQCTVDIGEPGVDRTFGRGVIDLDCLGAQGDIVRRF